MRYAFTTLASLVCLLVTLTPTLGMGEKQSQLEQQYHRYAERRAPKDGFPVLHNPEMESAEVADDVLEDQRWVIGIEINGDARAYPVGVMGVHELVNDRIGGHPVAVCW